MTSVGKESYCPSVHNFSDKVYPLHVFCYLFHLEDLWVIYESFRNSNNIDHYGFCRQSMWKVIVTNNEYCFIYVACCIMVEALSCVIDPTPHPGP